MQKAKVSDDLISGLRDWDGKSVAWLEEIYDQYERYPQFPSLLIEEFGKEETATQASWLLKRYLEVKGALSQELSRAVFSNLEKSKYWEEKLHILQCFQYLNMREADRNQLVSFIENCLLEKNKFVRAWAYNGYFLLAQIYPDMQADV